MNVPALEHASVCSQAYSDSPVRVQCCARKRATRIHSFINEFPYSSTRRHWAMSENDARVRARRVVMIFTPKWRWENELVWCHLMDQVLNNPTFRSGDRSPNRRRFYFRVSRTFSETKKKRSNQKKKIVQSEACRGNHLRKNRRPMISRVGVGSRPDKFVTGYEQLITCNRLYYVVHW